MQVSDNFVNFIFEIQLHFSLDNSRRTFVQLNWFLMELVMCQISHFQLLSIAWKAHDQHYLIYIITQYQATSEPLHQYCCLVFLFWKMCILLTCENVLLLIFIIPTGWGHHVYLLLMSIVYYDRINQVIIDLLLCITLYIVLHEIVSDYAINICNVLLITIYYVWLKQVPIV